MQRIVLPDDVIVSYPKKGDLITVGRYVLEIVDPKAYYVRLTQETSLDGKDLVISEWARVKGYPVQSPVATFVSRSNGVRERVFLIDGDFFVHHPHRDALPQRSLYWQRDGIATALRRWCVSDAITGFRVSPAGRVASYRISHRDYYETISSAVDGFVAELIRLREYATLNPRWDDAHAESQAKSAIETLSSGNISPRYRVVAVSQ